MNLLNLFKNHKNPFYKEELSAKRRTLIQLVAQADTEIAQIHEVIMQLLNRCNDDYNLTHEEKFIGRYRAHKLQRKIKRIQLATAKFALQHKLTDGLNPLFDRADYIEESATQYIKELEATNKALTEFNKDN